MTTIKDLARHLDISIGTVSRALNGRKDVNDETRRRVFEAAAEIGYVANQSGRALRQGTTNAIGFMIESGTEASANSDNFFMGVTDGLQTALARHDLDLVILPCSSEEDPHAFLRRMVARRIVDGIIITATQKVDPRIEFLANSKVPFAALGRSESGPDFPWIDMDFEGVARRSVDRLVANGHERIAVAVPASDINLGHIYLDTYKNALERHGIAFDPQLAIRTKTTEHGGYAIADEMLRIADSPTAVLLFNEILAVGLYRRFNEENLMPGRDVSVIGFRESPQSRFLSPRLTCYRLSERELGIALGETLLANMPAFADAYPEGTVGKIWPMELVEGESDAAAPK